MKKRLVIITVICVAILLIISCFVPLATKRVNSCLENGRFSIAKGEKALYFSDQNVNLPDFDQLTVACANIPHTDKLYLL